MGPGASAVTFRLLCAQCVRVCVPGVCSVVQGYVVCVFHGVLLFQCAASFWPPVCSGCLFGEAPTDLSCDVRCIASGECRQNIEDARGVHRGA